MHKNETGQIVFENNWEIAEYVSERFRRADAYEDIATRLDSYHKYVRAYCLLDGWGRNVFHTVIDDANKLRDKICLLKIELSDHEEIFKNLGL